MTWTCLNDVTISEYGSADTDSGSDPHSTSEDDRKKHRDLSERASNKVLFLGWTIILFAGVGHCGRYLVTKHGALHLSIDWLYLYFYSTMSGGAMHLFICLVVPWESRTTWMDVCKFIRYWEVHASWIACAIFEPLVTMSFIYLAAGDAMAINICCGPIGAILALMYFGQEILIAEWVGMFLSILGVLFIVRPAVIFSPFIDVEEEKPVMYNPMGYVYVTVGMLISSCQMILMPVCKRLTGPVTRVGIVNIGPSVTAIIYMIVWGIGDNIPHGVDWIYILCYAICTNASRFGWTVASDMVPISHQSIILSFDKVWAYFFGVVIFHEALHYLSVIGALEVWFALMIMAFYGQNSKSNEKQIPHGDLDGSDEDVSPLTATEPPVTTFLKEV